MFVRAKVVKGATYYQVVEGFRDGTGRVRHRTIASLGRHPTVEAALAAAKARPHTPAGAEHIRRLRRAQKALGGLTQRPMDPVPELRAAVEAGEVGAATARRVARLPPDEQRAALAGGREAIRAAVGRARLRAMEERLTGGRPAEGGRLAKPPRTGAPDSALPKPPAVLRGTVSPEEYGRRMRSADLVRLLDRLARFAWTPEEAAERFDEKMIGSLSLYLEPAERWLADFRRLWEATRGGAAATGPTEDVRR